MIGGVIRRPGAARSGGLVRALPSLVVIAALVAGCGTPGPTPSPVSAPSASAPDGSPGVTPLSSAADEPIGWTKLALAPLPKVASLVATKTGAASVAPDTAFRLTSLDGSPARLLAARLVADPPVSLAVVEESPDTAVLAPTAPLRPGQVYRFDLLRQDGSTAAAWAVQAAWPLRVATTLPGDQSTGVPGDTGIEVRFDQAGVRMADFRSHFEISPSVEGRFELHDETFVFVPLRPLAASTLYTVTVRRGLTLEGTGMRLERDEVVRFETTGYAASRVHVTLAQPLVDAATGERPAIGLRFDTPDEGSEPVRSVDVRIHELGGLTAALDAYRQVRAAPDWTELSSSAPVATTSLPLVLRGSLRVRRAGEDWSGWVRLPRPLSAGWYVATVRHAGVARQAVLQVTDLATFAMVSTTRSLVWVNDLRTNRPVVGARIALGGRSFGTTDAAGLHVGRTPASLVDAAREGVDSIAVIRSGGGAMLLPLPSIGACWECNAGTNEDWWHLLTTDRDRYRATDTVNVWGVIRHRDGGRAPATVRVRLTTSYPDGGVPAVVAEASASPDESGAFLARLSFSDLPPGEYPVSVRVGSTPIAESWVSVGPITKPAWRIALETPRRAVLDGAPIRVDATATFYEGTPVAGAALRVTGESDEEDEPGPDTAAVATTDDRGRATGSLTAHVGGDTDLQWTTRSIFANAREPEEADIGAALSIAIFRSTALLDLQPTVRGGTLALAGGVHDVDFDRLNDPDAGPIWDVDPRGAPRAGARVSLALTEVIPVVRQTGTRYDFIAKRTVPVYRVTERHRSLGTRTVTTRADGTFRLRMEVAGGDRSYEVRASYADEAGRTISTFETAWQDVETATSREARLVDDVTHEGWNEYGVGDTVRVRFQGGIARAEARRYLFAVSSRGVRSVAVQRDATFRTTFAADLVPELDITGVRFNGIGYDVALNGYGASLQLDDRRLDVRLTMDRDRYEPGGRATVAVRTLDAQGRPVSASVFVRTVDEKLFDVEGASEQDVLQALYESPGSGLLASSWSHGSLDVSGGKGEGGDTTGGGGAERADFRDWLVARMVTTGADGRASVSFDLSDDLTSWRVLAAAVSPRLDAGQASVSVPVGLPFFADLVVAPEYLTADRPIVRVRAFGSALRASADVAFTVSSDTLPMAVTTAHGPAFQPVEVALPALTVGIHRLRVEAVTGTGAGRMTDVLVRTFRVVDSRTVRRHHSADRLTPGTTVGGGDGTTTVVLVDAGRGRVVPVLRELAQAEPFRADSAIAASVARGLLADEFGIEDDPGLPAVDLGPFEQEGGVALLPYASADPELAALAALSGDPHLDRGQLRSFFADQELDVPTDRALTVLLGRASVGLATLGDVRTAAARADLTPEQQVTVALAAVAVGDQDLAARLERDLLAAHGERLGPWVRLDVGSREADALATGRLAIVAAAIGDPLAADMDAEIAAHPPRDTLLVLERAIAARYWTERTPAASAVVAVTLDGARREVTVSPDDPLVLEVTPAQRAGLRLDPVSGDALVVADWDGPLAEGDLAAGPGQSFERSVTPVGTIGATDLVAVTFRVRVGTSNDDTCWQVADVVPSGLAPVSSAGRSEEYDDEGDPVALDTIRPWRIVGQRVEFCVGRDARRPVQTLRYLARVVTLGAYRWEPAVMQSSIAAGQGIVLPAFDVTIEGLDS